MLFYFFLVILPMMRNTVYEMLFITFIFYLYNLFLKTSSFNFKDLLVLSCKLLEH